MVHQHLVVTLRHTHGRQNRTRGIGPHQQINLVGRHQLLVHGARQVRLGLVVFHDPLDLAAQQATTRIELLHVNFADQFVRQGRGRQRPGQGQRAADADGRGGLRLRSHGGQRRDANKRCDCGHDSTEHLHGLSPVLMFANVKI